MRVFWTGPIRIRVLVLTMGEKVGLGLVRIGFVTLVHNALKDPALKK